MKNLNEVLLWTNVDDIQNQIDLRIKLRSEMVGSLYPSILTDEIQQLSNRLRWVNSQIAVDHIIELTCNSLFNKD